MFSLFSMLIEQAGFIFVGVDNDLGNIFNDVKKEKQGR